MMKYQYFLKPLNHTKTASPPIKGWILVFVVNRLQVGYTVLLLPTQLVRGDHYWIIILAFIISQINMYLISKWINTSNHSESIKLKSLLPKPILYPLVLIGIPMLLIKFSVIIIGYTKIIQIYLLPEQRQYVILIVLLAVIAYLTSKGVHQITKFAFFAFLFSGWIIFAYIQFFFSPNVSFRELFPLIGEFNADKDFHSILYVLSAFSGPELLLFMKNRIKDDGKIYKYLTIGNTVTFIEYSLLFILAVLFYGSDYLNKVEYPLVTMARYIHTPFIDRLEMFIIPFFSFPLIFSLSLVNFYLYKGLQYSLRFKENNITFFSFLVFIGCIILFVQSNYWVESFQERVWISCYIYITAISYSLLPLGFFIIKRMKKS
ncbi:MAG: GerAB/ArcD/ProY family transporter [Bacillota bacterium]